METAPDDHDDGNGQDMGAEFWDPNDTVVELIGNLNPEDSDDVSALIFEQLGMVDQHQRNASKRNKTESMPDETAVGLPKELRSQTFLVSEMYSSSGITAEVQRGRYKRLSPGIAFD